MVSLRLVLHTADIAIRSKPQWTVGHGVWSHAVTDASLADIDVENFVQDASMEATVRCHL